MSAPPNNNAGAPTSTTTTTAAASPQVFALQHQRPRNSFTGCSRISDYELQGKLGEGTFGEVHRAKSRKTGKLVALKKIIMHNEKDGVSRSAIRPGANNSRGNELRRGACAARRTRTWAYDG